MQLNNKVATMSFFSSLIKVLIGPSILLIISLRLSDEEIALYFAFLSVISMQQMLEMGIGNVSKTFIAHSYASSDLIKASSHFRFMKYWFYFVAFCIILFIGVGGTFFFNYKGLNVEWLIPWFSLVIVSALTNILFPFFNVLESTDYQYEFRFGMLISSAAYGISLFIMMYFNCGLISISIAQLFGLIIRFLFSLKYIKKVELSAFKTNETICLLDCFKEMKSLLGTVTITWIIGYIYWNGIGLFVFQVENPAFSSAFMLCWNLCYTGYIIATSIVGSQYTMCSLKISKGDITSAFSVYSKYNKWGLILLITGYVSFFYISKIFDKQFDFFSKLPNDDIILLIMTFFVFSYILLTAADFFRCFKKDLFFSLIIYLFISTPIIVVVSYYILDKVELFYANINVIAVSLFGMVFFEIIKRKYSEDSSDRL